MASQSGSKSDHSSGEVERLELRAHSFREAKLLDTLSSLTLTRVMMYVINLHHEK